MEINIIPSRAYDEDERKRMVNVFEEQGFNATSKGGLIMESAEAAVLPVVHIVINIPDPYLTGLLGAAGAASWNGLITCLKYLINMRKNDKSPHIRLQFKDDKDLNVITFLPDDLAEMKDAVLKLPEYFSTGNDKKESICFEKGEWGTPDYHRSK